jgi:hypothetical protein
MKTKSNQLSIIRLKDLLKIGYQVASEEVRSSYPNLHVTTLLRARNPHFHGITLQGY